MYFVLLHWQIVLSELMNRQNTVILHSSYNILCGVAQVISFKDFTYILLKSKSKNNNCGGNNCQVFQLKYLRILETR